MKTHELKIAPEYFDDIIRSDKRFEIRRDDRGFKEGDRLMLKAWLDGEYTGAWCEVRVVYIARGCPGLEDGYCIMSTVFFTGKWFE